MSLYQAPTILEGFRTHKHTNTCRRWRSSPEVLNWVFPVSMGSGDLCFSCLVFLVLTRSALSATGAAGIFGFKTKTTRRIPDVLGQLVLQFVTSPFLD